MPPFVEVLTHRRARPAAERTHELSRGWARTLLVAWLVLYPLGALLEPAPADPDAGTPLLISVLGTVVLGSWLAAAAGLAGRRRYGATASLVASVGVFIAAAGCPASGHHAIGPWWYAQMAGASALVGLSALARGRRSARA
jgi:hypothetical protein